MEIRYEQVNLLRPRNIVGAKDYPAELELYVVYLKEKADSVPPGETPVTWILYTTHRMSSAAEALQVVGYYVMRWTIEDLFRTVKLEGLNYESSKLESGKALRKLFVLAFLAAIQILQLRQARSGETEQPTSLVFSPAQIACIRRRS
jgi:hypothetical protein